MSSNLLEKIKRIIQTQTKLDDIAVADIITFLENYKSGMWIYPGVLERKFHLSMKTVYSILAELEKQEIIKGYYELCCGNCQRSCGKVHTFNELPETFICENCGEELPTLQNAVLIYKVVIDE